MNVTIFKDVLNVSEPHIVPVDAVLHGIKFGKYRYQVEVIRKSSGNEKRELKSKLPCVLYCGEFLNGVEKVDKNNQPYTSFRDDRSLKKHSSLVPIDIDGLVDVEFEKEELKKLPYIYALWISPSGTGIHGLVKIGDPNKHSEHYSALLNTIKDLDPSARNPSRILYVSYDPDIYINPSCDTFYDIVTEKQREAVVSTGDGCTDYKKVDIACRMVRNAPDGQKHHSLNKAAYLLGGFIATKTVEFDVAYNALRHEISKRDIKDLRHAEKTIADGLAAGQYMPISAVEAEYREALEAVGENELEFLTDNLKDEDYIHRFRLGLIPQGLPFGYDRLDEHFLLKEGEFYAVLGHSHIGKSTWTLWMLFLSAFKYDWNWMVYCGENSPASVKIKLMQFFYGKRIQKFDEVQQRAALKFVDDHFFILSSNNIYTYREILDHAIKLMGHKSLKGVFIDPYNSLKIDLGKTESKYTYDYEAYSAMLTFTKKYNTTLFLSVHTTTGAQRDKDAQGNQTMPHATDAEGGSALYNRCDNFVTIHRKIKDDNEFMFTHVSIDKVRNDDTGGRPTPRSEPVIMRMLDKVEFTDEQGLSALNRFDMVAKYEFKV